MQQVTVPTPLNAHQRAAILEARRQTMTERLRVVNYKPDDLCFDYFRRDAERALNKLVVAHVAGRRVDDDTRQFLKRWRENERPDRPGQAVRDFIDALEKVTIKMVRL